MHRLKFIRLSVGLMLGNYVYQLLPGHHDWRLAGERSWFQFLALVAVWFFCRRDSASQAAK